MNKYDYLIVGAGLFGAVFAHEATLKGKTCLVIDKRGHIGGNIYTEKIEDIHVHKYGAHIFHTSNEEVWEYINNFSKFNNFVNSPIANYKGEIFNLPFNMNTFNKMWNVITPEEAKNKIEEDKKKSNIVTPKNLEEQAISLVGETIYKKLIKGYTEKQWGCDAKQLPKEIIKRLPVRFTYDNNYFNDKYQGIPVGGYTKIIEKMLNGVDVKLNFDFFENKKYLENVAPKIIYTGMIDEYYNYCYGNLQYRSLHFEENIISTQNYQGNAVVNYTDLDTPYTRIIEHKFFEFKNQSKTVITKEYPKKWSIGKEPFYPINNEENQKKYVKYEKLAKNQENIIFCGRLGQYKYYDMDKIIESALALSKNTL